MGSASVAIVTGAASGIGEQTAWALAARGVTVVVTDRDEQRGRDVTARLAGAGHAAEFVTLDVTDPAAHERIVGDVVSRHGRIDVAVNNAGVSGRLAPTGEYTVEEWREVLSIDLDGVFYGIRAQLPPMQAQGAGRIVNVASILGQVGFAGLPAYAVAKHGVVGLTKQVAQEYATAGIRANAVGPGFVATPLLERPELPPEAVGLLEQLHPVGRLGTAEEIGAAVAWLCLDAPDFLTGAYLPVDGGYLSR
jgi:NAD(P)-dependent dehydrogenase (short-subunit alcohol dehydrogenase family)